jgi:ABC-2 type transport system permease protein
MFKEIFRFEIQNKLRRPAIYIYFAAVLIFSFLPFATGSLPLSERQHINSPQMIAFWCAGMSMMMMLVSSSVMGMALYRDIEFTTKDYYLTYPITRGGYYWGRFVACFLFMLLLGAAILLGIFLATKLGPYMPWSDRLRYGPNHWLYYAQPYIAIVIPNLIFTSFLFYGLVSVTRNVKVVYTGGVLLFLAYFISVFFLNHTNNTRVMILSDPFLLTGVRIQMSNSNSLTQNTRLFSVQGDDLLNRFIWSGIGFAAVIAAYLRFNFERFFAGKKDKTAIDETGKGNKTPFRRAGSVNFNAAYHRHTLSALTRLELRNILRDNYFWVIIGAGSFVLAFSFWIDGNNYNVENFPRTSVFLADFAGTFLFFVFFIILFYTGETLHRDRVTRYAFINDSLPPPNWVFNASKLIALLVFAAALSLLPTILGPAIQLIKGYHHFNFPLYAQVTGIMILPRLVEMVLFSYAIHVVINNKFAAHAVAVTIWVAIFFLVTTHTFDYNLILYPYTPNTGLSDMDGMGHMAGPIAWFQAYWLCFGGLLIILAALFFHRGVSTSMKERLQLVPERFSRPTRAFTAILALLFFGFGAWLYYNVTWLNNYTTKTGNDVRAVKYERTLKHYDTLPLPVITNIRLTADLYPETQSQKVKAAVTITNTTGRPISLLLLDGDQLSNYSLSASGHAIPFTEPLQYDYGLFNWRSGQTAAPFRLYQLPRPLTPGDTTVIDVQSSIAFRGFQNDNYGTRSLRNGYIFTGGLPGVGYDDDDELSSGYERRKYHLPPKPDTDSIPQDDPIGIRTLKAGKTAHLMSVDLTVSTSGDQTAVAPGELKGQWQKNGRNYFHYVLDKPGSYPPYAVFSARYTQATDSITLDHKIYIHIFYHPEHNANIRRFIAGYKDALRYYSTAYGPYPYSCISLAESNIYSPTTLSLPSLDAIKEGFAWNARFTNPDQFDYCYYYIARLTAQQWWRYGVAPNATDGSLNIAEGLALYDGLVMMEHKYGKDNIAGTLRNEEFPYLFLRTRQEDSDVPMIKNNYWFSYNGKAGVTLYGLRDLIGEDSIDAALKQFRNEFAYRTNGPYAGANDLYRCLKAHTPDSMQYYLEDTWNTITLYDNQTTAVSAIPTGRPNEYKVTLNFIVSKTYIGSKDRETPATNMADYIDIGIFGSPTTNKTTGRGQTDPLYLQKLRLTAGPHTMTVTIHGKPQWAGIDPYSKLLDRRMQDNNKSF